jgi:hypothetical protein
MSFLPDNQLAELIQFAAIADKEARSDLSIGFIKDENDYTSNFTGALRRIINSNSQTGLSASSFLLQHTEEREMGADAAIVLSRGSESKVAVFEAKWPRFMTPAYQWDYAQTASGLSHFSDQLERQTHWRGQIAIFEMFYSEHAFGAQPPFLDPDGSSCVWHEDTEAFCNHRPNPDGVWSQAELQKLLTTKRVSISEVMNEFGMCNQGKPIRMVDPAEIGREFRLPPRLLAINANIERARRQK